MKRLLLVLFSFALCPAALPQNTTTDDLGQLTCECFNKILDIKHDTIEFQLATEPCFKYYYKKALSFSTPDSTDAFVETALNRLTNDCPAYRQSHEILGQMTLKQVKSRIRNVKACKIIRTGEFEEPLGTVRVVMSMKDSIQIMTYGKTGQYTKSRIIWQDDCNYTLIFVESTNPFENSMLKHGDQRKIRLVDIKNGKEIILETEIYNRWFLGRMVKID